MADSVYEDSMNTAPGRGVEDECSSVSARGRGADARTSRADRVGADDNQSADGCARMAARTHTETQTLSVKVISVSQ